MISVKALINEVVSHQAFPMSLFMGCLGFFAGFTNKNASSLVESFVIGLICASGFFIVFIVPIVYTSIKTVKAIKPDKHNELLKFLESRKNK